MKLTTALIASAFLATGMSVNAQGGRSFGNGTLPEFLKPYDTNNDGALSAEEREAARKGRMERAKEALDKWDTDGDGKLSPLEIEAARKAARAEIEAIRKARFDKADTNTNGYLSLEEFTLSLPPGMPANHVLRLYNFLNTDTTDPDLGISFAEFVAPCPKPPAPPPTPLVRFESVDSSLNGIITADEFTSFLRRPLPFPLPLPALTDDQIAAMFAKLDANTDNGITPDEWPVKDPMRPPVPPAPKPLPAFAIADKNSDTFVNAFEFGMAACASHIPALAARDLFRKADINVDYKLDATEYASIPAPAPVTTTP